MLLASLEALIVAVAASRYLRLPLGAGFLLYVSSTTLILYGADFLGMLQAASWSVHGLAAILGIVLIADVVRQQFWRHMSVVRPRHYIVALTVGFATIQAALLCSTREFASWDEFSHWGTIIRVIYEANSFHLSPNPLYFQDYPPGLALFSYHVLQLSTYSEGSAYFSYALLLGCFAASLLQLAFRLGLPAFFATTLLVWASVQVLGPGWASVLVDHMLVFYFAGIIAAYFLLSNSNKGLFILPIALGAFTLTKQAASSLALLAAGVILADWLIKTWFEHKQAVEKRFPFLFGAGFATSTIGATLVIPLTWQIHVTTAGLSRGWGSYSPSGLLANLISCCRSERELDVAAKFFGALFGNEVSPVNSGSIIQIGAHALTSISWNDIASGAVLAAPGFVLFVLALGSLLLSALSASGRDRACNFSFAVLMSVGAIGYALSLLLAYLYSFSDYEGRALASFDRFIGVFIVAWLLSLTAVALRTFACLGSRGRTIVGIGLFVVLLAAFSGPIRNVRPVLTPSAYDQQVELGQSSLHRIAQRASIQQLVASVRDVLPRDARVYIVWPKTSGLEFWLVKYELLPLATNLNCFAFTTKAEPELPEECKISPDQLRSTLRGYDYVMVGAMLDIVQAEYPNLFPATSGTGASALYQVQTTPDFRLLAVDTEDLQDVK